MRACLPLLTASGTSLQAKAMREEEELNQRLEDMARREAALKEKMEQRREQMRAQQAAKAEHARRRVEEARRRDEQIQKERRAEFRKRQEAALVRQAEFLKEQEAKFEKRAKEREQKERKRAAALEESYRYAQLPPLLLCCRDTMMLRLMCRLAHTTPHRITLPPCLLTQETRRPRHVFLEPPVHSRAANEGNGTKA